MHKHKIYPTDGLFILKRAGKSSIGDKFPPLGIIVSEGHYVKITDYINPLEKSTIVVCPLRLKDGALREKISAEPKFHSNAHYLVKITGPSLKEEKYHQFDKHGNYLK